jgi:hypothetical protein
MAVEHSGLPVWPPWLALVAQTPWFAGSSRLALWNQLEASVPQPAELRVVAQSVPLEPRIEEERAVPEP